MRKKLLEQRAAAIARCDELSAIRETRELTEAEQVEFRSTLDKAKQLGEDILAAEELDRERAEQQVAEQRAAAAPAQQRPNSAPGHLEVHDNAEDVPFPDFGDFLRAVQVNATERTMDPRLRKSDIRNPQVRAAAGMNEEVASSGGFLVMTEIGAMIEKAAFETGMLASKTTKIPLGPNSNGMKLPGIDETSRVDGSRWGGVRGYWLNEAGSLTSSKPKFRNIELGLNKLAVLVYATDEMLADATTLGSVIQRSASEEFGFKLDDAVVRGTGAGVPLGILNAACTVSVSKETSQVAASILYENISKMRARMLPRSFANAQWFINVDCMPQLEKMFIPHKNVAGSENVSGQSVWMPPRGAQDPPNGTIFGRPVNVVEQCETVGTVGDIILADLGMYLMTTKGGVQAASSIHVNFLTDETAFRFIMRTDGQPSLNSAITPYKGTGTLSSFVTLATRA